MIQRLRDLQTKNLHMIRQFKQVLQHKHSS